MRKIVKTSIALLCILAMLAPTCVFGADDIEVITAESSEEITADGSEEITVDVSGAETTATYTYIEFGSYPQSEVVSQASDSGVYGKAWSSESDYIVDATLYNTLKNLSEDKWDANGDTTVDGNKYRRINADDVTRIADENIECYYDWTSSTTYHYFKYEPIKWRILEQDGGDLFLLSELVLDDQKYSLKIKPTLTWENCTMRSWLNGYGASANESGVDYSNDNFINTAFSSEELARIKTTTIANTANNSEEEGIKQGNDTNDRIYLLSGDEVYGSTATKYGFANDSNAKDTARQAKSSTYAKAMGTYADCDSTYLGNDYWWLRSAGSHPGLFADVRRSGSVDMGGLHATSEQYRGVRPALHMVLEGEFIDVNKSDWFYDDVKFVQARGIMTGMGGTYSFAPYDKLHREQLAVMLYRLENEPSTEYEYIFPDVPDGKWYSLAVTWAYNEGIIHGYDSGYFGVADNITREQLAVMLYRYAKKYAPSYEPVTADLSKFTDASSISSWAREAIEWAVGTGIITGKNEGTKIDPQGNAARCECAAMFHRFMVKYEL